MSIVSFFKCFSPSEQKLRAMLQTGIQIGRKQLAEELGLLPPARLAPVEQTLIQPVYQATQRLAHIPRPEPRLLPCRPGGLIHAQRAKTRFVERLGHVKHSRLVMPCDLNSQPGDTDALKFACADTEAFLPQVRNIPHVG